MSLKLEPRPGRRLTLENRDPEEIWSRGGVKVDPSDDVPAVPRPPAAKGSFLEGEINGIPKELYGWPEKRGTAAPQLSLPTSAPATSVNPEPEAAIEQTNPNLARLRELENTKPTDQNGRWKSFLRSALNGMSANARVAAQTGMPNGWAYALGGAAGHGIAGAIDPALDEREKAEEEKARLRADVAAQQAREENEADIGYKKARPTLELAKITKDAEIEAAKLQLQRDLEAGRISRDEADQKQKELDRQSREREGQLNRESRERVAAGKEKDLKIPDTFYRGKDDTRVKNDAMAEVLSKPEYHQTGMRPDILEAYGNDMDRINKAIRNGEMKPSELFTDPTKGAMFQRDLAATYSRKAGEAQEFDRAVDMTSKSKSAQLVSYADFETTWQKFLEDYKAAKSDKERQAIRSKFESAIRSVRLTGD